MHFNPKQIQAYGDLFLPRLPVGNDSSFAQVLHLAADGIAPSAPFIQNRSNILSLIVHYFLKHLRDSAFKSLRNSLTHAYSCKYSSPDSIFLSINVDNPVGRDLMQTFRQGIKLIQPQVLH